MSRQNLGQGNTMGAASRWELLPVLMLGVFWQAESAIAHGVVMKYQTTEAIVVQSAYDSGEPMANAQVTVYAPKSDKPWLKGTTDANGRFVFTPDRAKPGSWNVKVRSAGHGNTINVIVAKPTLKLADDGQPQSEAVASRDDSQSEPQLASVSDGAGYTPLQKGVMTAAIIWGCIGTALFFRRRKA